MGRGIIRRFAAVATAVIIISAAGAAPVVAAGPNQFGVNGRWLVVAKSSAEYASLKADVLAAGGRILRELSDIDTLVVAGGANVQALASDSHASGVAADHVEQIAPPEGGTASMHAPQGHPSGGSGYAKVTPDPAFSLPGLMWNVNRVGAPQAWRTTTGSPAVTVGVADTGLDYTHSELEKKGFTQADVVDLTASEDPPLCKTYYGSSDADWAATYGGPADTDWNGHGTWIGGNIAAALDGVGINGIAPNIKLVALKISQWCGSAYDSTILEAFTYAANHGIDVVSISFGGYLDLTKPDEALIYQQYVKAVAYALRKGTLIVAAAGNEHVRIGARGRVLSHGPLTTPGATFVDYYGLYENPGGVPGVVDVSSTGNVVNAPTASCVPDPVDTSATCKPSSDAHQPFGIGKQNQLAYYSNYGPRIDVAAPGGARKFNLPVWDRGGTPGWPVTDADGTAAFEDFSITSNWALEIPCYLDLGPQFYPGECYSTIQGTSMATPHASAVVALIASRYPFLRHQPLALTAALKLSAQHLRSNTTPPLSATDASTGDLSGLACATGYCHLGGAPISDSDAYGAGLVDAASLGGFGR